MINYNLQQSPQSPRVTATPVDRVEWADDLESLGSTLSTAIKTVGKAYQQSEEAAAKAEGNRLLNQFQSDVYNLKSEYNRTRNPSPSKFQDRLQKLRELPQYQTLKASDMNAVITSQGIESITPGWMQAAKTEAAEDAKRIVEERQQLYDLGIARLGIDQASEMSYDSIVEMGKKVASDSQAISLAVQNINDPNASSQIKDMSLNMSAEVLSENVGYDIDKAIGADQKITRVMLNQERDKIAYDLRTNKGLLAADAVYIANQAIKKWEPLVAMSEMSLKDQATFAAQQSKATDDILNYKRALTVGLSSQDWKALNENYDKLDPRVRAAINNSLMTYFGNTEQNKEMIEALTGGSPEDLKTVGENVSKVLDGLSTTRQKTATLLSALEVYKNSVNEEASSIANKTPQEFTQDMQNAIDNYFWLGNKLTQNIQAMDEALGNAEQIDKDYAKTTYTDAISDLSKYKLIDTTVNARGELSLVDGYLRSNNSLDRDRVKEINDILADAYNTNEKSGGLLLDKEALTRNLKMYIEDYKLAKEDNLQWWQYPAIAAMPIKGMGRLGRSPRRQALAEQAGDTEEPWLNTFQGALTGAEIGGVIGGAPGALIGGGVGGLGTAIAQGDIPSPAEAYKLADEVSKGAGKTGLELLRRTPAALSKLAEETAAQKDIEFGQTAGKEIMEKAADLEGKAKRAAGDKIGRRPINWLVPGRGIYKYDPDIYQRIKNEENIKLESYKDDTGKNTIGYGFNIVDAANSDDENFKAAVNEIAPGLLDNPTGKHKITEDQADRLLALYINTVAVNDAIKVCDKYGVDFDSLSPARQHALVDMAYHQGYGRWNKEKQKYEGGLQSFKNMFAALKDGRWGDAAMEARKSNYGKTYSTRAYTNALLLASGEL